PRSASHGRWSASTPATDGNIRSTERPCLLIAQSPLPSGQPIATGILITTCCRDRQPYHFFLRTTLCVRPSNTGVASVASGKDQQSFPSSGRSYPIATFSSNFGQAVSSSCASSGKGCPNAPSNGCDGPSGSGSRTSLISDTAGPAHWLTKHLCRAERPHCRMSMRTSNGGNANGNGAATSVSSYPFRRAPHCQPTC